MAAKPSAATRNIVSALALISLGGVIAAAINLFHPIDWTDYGLIRVFLWPTAISPAWLGLLAAALAVFVMTMIVVGLGVDKADDQASTRSVNTPPK